VDGKAVFRGGASAKIDEKGRLKIPTVFRNPLLRTYGAKVFVTSLDNAESGVIYPFALWEELERRFAARAPTDGRRGRFFRHAYTYGQEAEIDSQGRVLIPTRLRESAAILGDIDVLGQFHYLELWNRTRLDAKNQRERFTDADGAIDPFEFNAP
jgi:MraZ protein